MIQFLSEGDKVRTLKLVFNEPLQPELGTPGQKLKPAKLAQEKSYPSYDG